MGSSFPRSAPQFRASFPEARAFARALHEAMCIALSHMRAPAFLLRADGRLEHANLPGLRELRARGPGLLRSMASARVALASDQPSPLLADGAFFEMLDVQQSNAVTYVLVVLRTPSTGRAANDAT